MKTSLFLACLILALVVKGQDTLSLEQAINLGLENNFSAQIAKNNQLVAKKNNNIVNAGFLPEFNLTHNDTRGITDSRVTLSNGQTREGSDVNTSAINQSAILSYTVFDGFTMFIAKDRLEELEKVGEYQARWTIENTVAQIVVAYYAIVQQQKMQFVIQEAITLSIERLKLVEVMSNIGTAAGQTVLQANVDVNADSARLIQQIAIIKNSKADLNRLLGRDVAINFFVRDNIKLNQDLSFDLLQQKFENSNPQLLLARSNINLALNSLRSVRSTVYPTLDIFGGYNSNRNTNPISAAPLIQSSGLTYGLSASINLFSGFSTLVNAKSAKLMVKSNRLQYEDIRIELQNELFKNYNNYISSLQLIKLQANNVELARQDVDISMGRFRLGHITDIDLRITQQKLIDLENQLLVSQYNAKLAEIELQRLSGQLLSVL